MEDAVETGASTRLSGRLGVLGFVLSLVVLGGTTVALLVIDRVPGSIIGAVIDSQDDNYATESERAMLDNVAMQIGWVFFLGTVLGVIAIILSAAALVNRARPAQIGRLAALAIVASFVAPLVFLLISGGTLLAASVPHT